MNKLLLLALVGFALIALTGADEQESETSLQNVEAELAQQREIREADPKKKKKSGKKGKKGLKKKNKKKKGKKGKKSLKKKNKKRKNKGKKKAKKSKKAKKNKKKNKKAKKGKKGKKGKKAKKSKKAKSTETSARACAVSDSCVTLAVTYMKMNNEKVSNYLRQQTRITKQNKTGGNKAGKKSVFVGVLSRLTQAGGGNASSLMCGTSSTNAGAKQMANLTETLKGCEKGIVKACDTSNLPQPNTTAVTICTSAMTKFTNKLDECRKKTGAEACTCWSSTTLSDAAKVIKDCKLSDKATAMAKALSGCRSAFSKCRKYEDDVASVIHACSLNTKGLLSKLKQLNRNKAAVEAAQKKINELTGSSGKRNARALASCSVVITSSTTLITLMSQNSGSKKIFTLATSISTTTVTCTAAEKTSLTSISTSITSALTAIAEEIAAVQSTVLELTGSTASTSEINNAAECGTDDCSPAEALTTTTQATTTASTTTTTTTAAVVTTASSGRRRRLAVEDFLKNKVAN